MSPRSLDQQILKPRLLFLMSTSVGCPVAPSWIPLTKITMIQLIYLSPLFALPPTPLFQSLKFTPLLCGLWLLGRMQMVPGWLSIPHSHIWSLGSTHKSLQQTWQGKPYPSCSLSLSHQNISPGWTPVHRSPCVSWGTQRLLSERAALCRLGVRDEHPPQPPQEERRTAEPPSNKSPYKSHIDAFHTLRGKRIFENCETGVLMFPLKKISILVFLTTYFSNCSLVYLEVLVTLSNSTVWHKNNKLFQDAHKLSGKARKWLIILERTVTPGLGSKRKEGNMSRKPLPRASKGGFWMLMDGYSLYY